MKTYSIRLLLLLTLIAAIAVASFAYFQKRVPQNFPEVSNRAPGENAIKSYSSYLPGEIRVNSSLNGPSTGPVWYQTDPAPPLSARDAVLVAIDGRTQLDGLPKEGWELTGCELKPWNFAAGHWYWLVKFRIWSDETPKTAKQLTIAVKMNGECSDLEIIDNGNAR